MVKPRTFQKSISKRTATTSFGTIKGPGKIYRRFFQ
jgi:hypothetical protein